MKALSVRQPWAWAIAKGYKNVENRSWTATYRGPLAIHAAARWDDYAVEALRDVVRTVRAMGVPLPKTLADDLPYSDTRLVVAVVDLVDICTRPLRACDCGPWAIAGQSHWQLANARLLPEPFAAKGRLGLWNVEMPELAGVSQEGGKP